MGGYQSGQMGRTVNPLLRLRRFESFSPHKEKVSSGQLSVSGYITANRQLQTENAEVAQLVER